MYILELDMPPNNKCTYYTPDSYNLQTPQFSFPVELYQKRSTFNHLNKLQWDSYFCTLFSSPSTLAIRISVFVFKQTTISTDISILIKNCFLNLWLVKTSQDWSMLSNYTRFRNPRQNKSCFPKLVLWNVVRSHRKEQPFPRGQKDQRTWTVQ